MLIYLELFISFFKIGLFSIGGGYAALPLIQEQVVNLHHWIDITQFTDLITISQMTPGPIAINSSTFVGTLVAGLPGAIIATLGCVAPSCIIVLGLAYIYEKYRDVSFMQGILSGLRPSVVALIGGAGLSIVITTFWGSADAISLSNTNYIAVGLFLLSLFILRKWKPNPVLVMAGVGIIGMFLYI